MYRRLLRSVRRWRHELIRRSVVAQPIDQEEIPAIPGQAHGQERVATQIYPGATVLPSMSTGASDQAQLRAKGIQSYGIGPGSTESDEINYGAHGDVERLAESSLYPFVQYVWMVVTEVARHR